jgi:hypothetical protein
MWDYPSETRLAKTRFPAKTCRSPCCRGEPSLHGTFGAEYEDSCANAR